MQFHGALAPLPAVGRGRKVSDTQLTNIAMSLNLNLKCYILSQADTGLSRLKRYQCEVMCCLGDAAVRRRTRDRKVAGSTPGRGAIKSIDKYRYVSLTALISHAAFYVYLPIESVFDLKGN